jgi:hypothetical protein
MAAKKEMTKAQAEKEVKRHKPKYREYVAAQVERKNAKSKAAKNAAQKKMDALRSSYTAYRNAYRVLVNKHGGITGKANGNGGSKPKPKAAKPKAKRSAAKPKAPKAETPKAETTGVQVEQ